VTKRYILSSNFSKAISAGTSLSNSAKLYANLENRTVLEVKGINSTKISIIHNYSPDQIEVIDKWRPMARYWNVEYTHMTAIDSGAYDETQTSIVKKHTDNESIYWKREFILTPKVAQNFNFTVYYDADTALLAVNNITLTAYPYPEPTYNVQFPDEKASIEELLALDSIKITNLKDFTKARDWYQIHKYTISIFSDKHQVVYNEVVRSSAITNETKKQLKKLKKGGVILIQDIRTTKESKDFININIQ
jgi:hypothetical protein